MNNHILTPPPLDDETVVTLCEFFYELLAAFESHYTHQIRRHHRNLQAQRMNPEFNHLEDDNDGSF